MQPVELNCRMRGARGRRGALAFATLLVTAPALADPPLHYRPTAHLGAGYDDNVGNAAQDADVRTSGIVTGGVNLEARRALTSSTAVSVRLAFEGEAVAAESGLTHGRAAILARLSHRPGAGFYAPVLGFWIEAAHVEYDSRLRDGAEYRAGVSVIESLTTAVSARLSLTAIERIGAHEAFELSQQSAAVSFDWAVAWRCTVYAGYQLLDGDIVSSGRVPPKSSHGTGGGALGGASAGVADDALEDLFAYRVDATTRVVTLGANVPLSQRLALDGQVRHVESSFGADDYGRWQGNVSALLRF